MPYRRELIVGLTTVWLARVVHAAQAAPSVMNDALRIRLRKLDELSHALARREIQPVAWQRGAAQVCEGIDVQELCRAADFDSGTVARAWDRPGPGASGGRHQVQRTPEPVAQPHRGSRHHRGRCRYRSNRGGRG